MRILQSRASNVGPRPWRTALAVVVAFGATSLISATPAGAIGTTHFSVTGYPSSSVAGTGASVVVRALKSDETTDTTYLGTVHFTTNDVQAARPANFTFPPLSNGVATVSGFVLKTVTSAGTLTATDTSTSSTGSQTGLTVTPAPTSKLSVTNITSPIAAGTPSDVLVTAQDTFGNTTPTYAGQIGFTSSAAGTLPGLYTYVPADNGVHNFVGGVTLKSVSPPPQSVTATDLAPSSSITGTQSGISVVPKLSVTGLTSPTAGTPSTVVVTAVDALAPPNVITTYTGMIHFTSSDTAATLPINYLFAGSDSGSRTFTNGVTFHGVGTQSVTATDTSTAPTTGTKSASVAPGAATHLDVTAIPLLVNRTVAQGMTVTARDQYNNTATGYTGTVHVTSSDATATLPSNHLFTLAEAGVHNFPTGVVFQTPGTQSVTATDVATSSITGVETGIVVSPLATSLAVSAPDSSTAGVPFNITVTANDAGDTDTNYLGMVHFTTTDPTVSAIVPPDYQFVAGDLGVHQFTNGVTLKKAGAMSVTATDTSTPATNGLATITVGPATTSKLASAFNGGAATVSGVPHDLVVTAQDQFGNTTPAYVGTVAVTSTDTLASLPSNTPFVVGDNGVHTFSPGPTLRTAGTKTITATDTTTASIAGATPNITVNPGAAASLLVAGITDPTMVGVVRNVTVTARDAAANVATGYLGTVAFTSTDGAASLPAPYQFVSGDNGVRVFTGGVTLKTAGTRSVTATDTVTSSISGLQSGIAVTPAAAASIVVSTLTSPIVAGVAQNLVITVKDALGNVATGYQGTVHITSSDSQAVVPENYLFSSDDAGVRTFTSGLALKTVGAQTVTATDTVTSTITGQAGTTVTPAATSLLHVTGIATPIVSGASSDALVTAVDAFGNTTPAYVGTIHITSTDSGATRPADYTFTGTGAGADNGVHNFVAGVVMGAVGTWSVIATDTTTSSITGSQTGIVVVPILVVSGITSPTVAGTARDVTVTVKDVFNNVIIGYTGIVHFTSDDVQAILPANYTFTGSGADNGSHIFTGGVMLKTVGSHFVTATDTATSAITGSQSSIAVTPAAAVSLLVGGIVSPTVAGVALDVTVTAKDAFGNTATGYTGIVHFTSDDVFPATLPANRTFVAGDNGVHTFTGGVTLKTVGTRAVTATDTVTSSITGSQSAISVTPASAATLAVSGITSPTVAGAVRDVTVTAKDAFGNTVTGYTGNVTFTSDDLQATLPHNWLFTSGSGADNGVHTFVSGVVLKTAGSHTVTATDMVTSSVTGSQAAISVTPASTANFLVSGITSPTVAGAVRDITVAAKDAFGNTATGYTGTIHFTSDDAQASLPANRTFVAGDNGVHTFTGGATLKTVGSRAVTATDTVTSSITGSQSAISVTPASTILVVSGIASTAIAGVARDVTVSAKDSFGNVITGYTGTVHFTSDDLQAVLPANRTFVAGDNGVHTFTGGVTLKTAGTKAVTATDSVTSSITGLQSGLVVTPAAASLLSVSGVPSPTAAGVVRSVTVTAKDAFGNTATGYAGTVRVTSSDAQATLPANWTFGTADNGSYTFVGGLTLRTAGTTAVTATDTATSSITGSQSAITVTPAPASMMLISGLPSATASGIAQPATVTVRDTLGNIATGYTGIVHFTSSDAGALLPADYTFTSGDAGMHTFAASFATSGLQTVTVADSVVDALKVTSAEVQVAGPQGYWLVARDGGVFNYGNAPFFGSEGGSHLNRPIVAMAKTPSGLGYWLVASDGGIFTFGDAQFLGSTGSDHLNAPIVGMTATRSGLGYYLLARDGGIFTFGDAQFLGSTGATVLNAPIIGMALTRSGHGYWLVASDGGMFSFGDAVFQGSAGGGPLNQPIVGMARTQSGNGYWLVARDGGIFAFGDAVFPGSAGGIHLNSPIVGLAGNN